MHNIGNYDYEKLSESVLVEIQAWNGEYDPETLKGKSKAAHAFALWVLAIQGLCVVQHQVIPGVKAAEAEAKEAAEAFKSLPKSCNF